jgi:hypothetical protein
MTKNKYRDWQFFLEAKKEIFDKIPFEVLQEFCQRNLIFIFTKDKNFLVNKLMLTHFSLDHVKELIKLSEEYGN